METMNLEITRTDLEEAIPVATSKNDDIFELIRPYIDMAKYEVAQRILGDAGINAVNNNTHKMLTLFVKQVACFDAFLPNFRSLDLVLTATGFGVVSTQDLTPASKARVDALKSQLDVEQKKAEGRLLRELFKLEGWSKQPQRVRMVPSLFFAIWQLSRYAGIESPTMNDWRRVQPLITEADTFLREHISDALMDRLIAGLTSNSLTVAECHACSMIYDFIGLHIAGNPRSERVYYQSLMNQLENNLDDYPSYRDSEAYKTNHFKGYENTKESGVFIFQG